MDPIADFLTQIRNTIMAGKTSVRVSHSKAKERIANILSRLGYIEEVQADGKGVKQTLSFKVVQDEYGQAKIKGMKRVSKVSRRHYVGYKSMQGVKHGHGNLIVSTPKGILTEEEAKKEKIGGEALFQIW